MNVKTEPLDDRHLWNSFQAEEPELKPQLRHRLQADYADSPKKKSITESVNTSAKKTFTMAIENGGVRIQRGTEKDKVNKTSTRLLMKQGKKMLEKDGGRSRNSQQCHDEEVPCKKTEKELAQRGREMLEKMSQVVEDVVGGAQCRYECRRCGRISCVWTQFAKHECPGATGKVIPSRDVHRFLTKAVAHRCKMCSRLVLCDSSLLSTHFSGRHGISVKNYRKSFSCSDFPRGRDKTLSNVLAKATISSVLKENECIFRCPECQDEHSSWRKFSRHKCAAHRGKFGIADVDKYVIKSKAYQCKLCPKKVLCDELFIKWHAYDHRMTTTKYRQEVDPKNNSTKRMDMEELLSQGTLIEEVGNFCKFKCEGCSSSFVTFAGLRGHKKSGKCKSACASILKLANFKKLYIHRCKLCSKFLLCFVEYTQIHMKRHHKLSLTDYCKLTGVSFVKAQRCTRETKVSLKVGNYCRFRCKFCEWTTKSWPMMAAHSEEKHGEKSIMKRRYSYEDYLAECVMHKCGICAKLVLCEHHNIETHVRNAHNISVSNYLVIIGQEDKGAIGSYHLATFRAATRDFPTFDVQSATVLPPGKIPNDKVVTSVVGNLCLFKCDKCDRDFFPSWLRLEYHLAKEHNSEVRFKPERVAEARYHQCLLCPKVLLCDLDFLERHLQCLHRGMRVSRYYDLIRERGGDVVKPKYTRSLAGQLKLMDEDGNDEGKLDKITPDMLSSESEASDCED